MFIITGSIIIAVGALIVMKSEWMLSNFGPLPFFERYLPTEGGSRFGWKLIGMIIIFIGTLVLTNMIGSFLTWTLSPLLKYNLPENQSIN